MIEERVVRGLADVKVKYEEQIEINRSKEDKLIESIEILNKGVKDIEKNMTALLQKMKETKLKRIKEKEAQIIDNNLHII